MRKALIAAIAVLAATPAWADDLASSPRLAHLASIPGLSAPMLRALSGSSLPLLSAIERGRLQSGRTKLYPVDLGFGSLTFGVTRYKGGKTLMDGFYNGMGRYTAQAVGAEFAMPLTGDIALRAEGSMTRISRRYTAASPHGLRSTGIGQFNVGVVTQGVSLMAGWVRPEASGRGKRERRWTEMVGFVPPARQMFHLGLTTNPEQSQRGQWMLTATTIDRAGGPATPEHPFSGMADRRIEAGYRLTF